ncbi:LLM class flavin-dependent oxidoreductase [Aquibacillus kalidii]|uniref:LLM class flavin-dependent oxidoreductase n=1 Tax=Aquibacillus kalidii TaxID=2762597 RepID=UPI0016455A5B|nr:LLM class flavin-dependent oxidoreductase [Aquibacillus kalidii]
MKLGVLDQVPISRGSSPVSALENTIKLAKITEQMGYSRYWVAEHHSTNGLASTSPEILIARIASATSRIRVGSGGVLLPQYAPLKVAENFKLLEGLFPGRIDLGIGRSPGGSEKTRMALTDGAESGMNSFLRKVTDLKGFLHNTLPRDHDYRLVKASPRTDTNPDMWILGLSERSAYNAARLGVGYTFGHFINPTNGERVLTTYREQFLASENSEMPQSNVCIFVVCAETQEKAEEIALSQDKWLLNVGAGRDTKVPSIEEVKSNTFTEVDIHKIKQNRKRTIVGTPNKVKDELERLSDLYHTDEFLIITNIYDFDDKVKSYRLIAEKLL